MSSDELGRTPARRTEDREAPVSDASFAAAGRDTAPSMILFMVAAGDRRDTGTCLELMTPVDRPDIDALCVDLTRTSGPWIERWRQLDAGRSGHTEILTAADRAAGGGDGSGPSSDSSGTLDVERIASPGNLTQLGIQITTSLERFESSENDLVVCFHSLTALLQYHDESTTYRFLNELTNVLAGAGATGHVHVDPTAHEDRTINRMKSLFDAVIDASRYPYGTDAPR